MAITFTKCLILTIIIGKMLRSEELIKNRCKTCLKTQRGSAVTATVLTTIQLPGENLSKGCLPTQSQKATCI